MRATRPGGSACAMSRPAERASPYTILLSFIPVLQFFSYLINATPPSRVADPGIKVILSRRPSASRDRLEMVTMETMGRVLNILTGAWPLLLAPATLWGQQYKADQAG